MIQLALRQMMEHSYMEHSYRLEPEQEEVMIVNLGRLVLTFL